MFNRKPRIIVASGPEGEPLRGRVIEPPGCRKRLAEALRWLASRLPWVLVGGVAVWLVGGECQGVTRALVGLAVADLAVGLAVLVLVLAKG